MDERRHAGLRRTAEILRSAIVACGCLGSVALAQTPEPPGPDLRPVYRALEAGELDRAEAELDRLRNNFVGWDPPPELSRMIADARAERAVAAAKQGENPEALILAGERYPEAFRCQRVDLAWPLADAYIAVGRRADAWALYDRLVSSCSEAEDRLATLYRALETLSVARIDDLVRVEKDRSRPPPAEAAFALFKLRAARRGASIDLSKAAEDLAAAPDMTDDPAAMLELGWAWYDLGHAAESLKAFERALEAGGGDEARLAAAEIAVSLDQPARAQRALAALENPREGRAMVESLMAQAVTEQTPPPPGLLRLAETVAANAQSASLDGLLAAAHARAGEINLARERLDRAFASLDSNAVGAEAGDRLVGAAWSLLDAEKAALAVKIFELADRLGAEGSAEGRVRALMAVGDLAGAHDAAKALHLETSSEATRILRDLARLALAEGDRALARTIAAQLGQAPDFAAERETLLGEIVLADGYAAYESGRYVESADYAAKARSFGAEGASLLLGWSLYQAGNYAGAAESFAAALTSKDRESAIEGLALAAHELPTETRNRYAALAPEVAETIAARSGETAYYRDQMYLAQAKAGGTLVAVQGLEKGWMQSGLGFRHTKGAPGIDRFTMFSPYLAGRMVTGAAHLTAVLELPRIKAGRAAPSPEDGEIVPGRIGPKRETLVVPSLTWVREGEMMDLRLGLSTTPIGGETSVLPTFDFGLTHYREQGGRVDFALRGQSRVDSLLSYAGSNAGFGRVIEYGASVQMQQPIGRWTVTAEMHASLLDGEEVEDNTRIGGNIGLMRSLTVPGFDYLSFGPNLTLDHYDENLDFFTPGNGGYFSPQFFALGAVVAAFQTKEARDFILRGVLLAGGEVIRRDDGFDNPFDRSSERLPSVDSSGPVGTFRFEGAYRLSSHWSIVGDFGSAFTDDFTEYRAGIALRYNFGARRAMTSADIVLPRQGFSQR